MNVLEKLRLKFGLPYHAWVYLCPRRGEYFCPRGNQPEFPFTTHIFWNAINTLEAMMDGTGLMGIEKPPKMPGNYLVCFRKKDLAEKFRRFTGIDKQWRTTQVLTENVLSDAVGNVPFVVFINEYVGEESIARESGFRWQVCHCVCLDENAGAVDVDGL